MTFIKKRAIWGCVKVSAVFHLEILTPECLFFEGDVEVLSFTTTDGLVSILAGHIPFAAPLAVGSIQIKKDGIVRHAFQSEGFINVDRDCTHVFAQACEWPENIDANRAKQAEIRARERMLQQKSRIEYEWSKVALARAMARLREVRNK